jgi:hypothetical protein
MHVRDLGGELLREPVTTVSAWDLVCRAVVEVHAISRRYARDRWFFLSGRRYASDAPSGFRSSNPRTRIDLRRQVFSHTLFNGVARPEPRKSTDGLYCTIDARKYRPGHPATVSVRFFRRVGHEIRTLTIRLGVVARGSRSWPAGWNDSAVLQGKRTLERRSFQDLWWEAARRSAKRSVTTQLWWVDPGATPQDVTLFAFVIFLWRAEIIDLGSEAVGADSPWTFVKRFIKGQRCRGPSDSVVGEVLRRMGGAYAFPKDWRELRKYLGKTIRSVRGLTPPHLQRTADRFGISVRQLYREMAREHAGQPGFSLSPEEWDRVEERASKRKSRREAINILRDSHGKSEDAARKLIARRRAAGWPWESIVGDLRRGRIPRV